MSEDKLKRTPLYETHVKYGGRMVPFAGWEMPVQYAKGVIAEHMAVRTGCGMFDVSHMGEISCTGREAFQAVNMLLTNDYSGMVSGQARYSPMCNEEGGVVDDVIVYKVNDEYYMIVVNAANIDKDFEWMTTHNTFDAVFSDLSADFGQIALQGPKAEAILRRIVPGEYVPEKGYTAKYGCDIHGAVCVISRTGYTGEDGFEIYVPSERTPEIWELLMEEGREFGLEPAGLGARDTLRLEAGMPLYGHEMDDTVTPLEAGLGIFVKQDKPDFLGKAALMRKNPPARRKVGLEVTGRGILREHMDVYRDGVLIGHTTSGTKCPYIDKAVAAATVDTDKRELGATVQVDVRGRMVYAVMVKSQFYKRGEK